MKAVPSISRWDAIVGEEVVLFVDPGACPTGAGSTNNGVYLSRQGDLVHLGESRELAERLSKKSTLVVVEADERSYRITRIAHRILGALR